MFKASAALAALDSVSSAALGCCRPDQLPSCVLLCCGSSVCAGPGPDGEEQVLYMNASRDTSTHTNILSYEPAPDGTLQAPREQYDEQRQQQQQW
jgi:hypothetical protein